MVPSFVAFSFSSSVPHFLGNLNLVFLMETRACTLSDVGDVRQPERPFLLPLPNNFLLGYTNNNNKNLSMGLNECFPLTKGNKLTKF
jgi:hypothetical protein